jgi:hypothetical protein
MGIHAEAMNGAVFRYGDSEDPNQPDGPVVINPGIEDRFVTCLSDCFSRNSNGRFNFAFVALAGAYCPSGPTAIYDPELINLAFFQSPPYSDHFPARGYVARIAIDVSAIGLPNSAFAAYRLGEEPDGAVPVVLSQCTDPDGLLGTMWASWDHPALTGMDWGTFQIPEPTAALLCLALASIHFRRSRRSSD